MATTSKWDPTLSDDWNRSNPNNMCLKRIKKDLLRFHTEPPADIYIAADERDVTLVHALVVGPAETPYEGGFFYFLVRFPPDYPIRSPRVKLMTTGENTVRFNPNLYRNGKVCLSIIGTWEGPAWYPGQHLLSVLLSIQSLMCENPYFNEPGVTMEFTPGDSRRYNDIVTHETIRVAVCGMVEGTTCDSLNMPDELRRHAERVFLERYQRYLEICDRNAALQGSTMNDPYRMNHGKFDYLTLKKRLHIVRGIIEKKQASRA